MAKRGGFPGGMPGNMNNIMKQAQKMQKQMAESFRGAGDYSKSRRWSCRGDCIRKA